MSDPLKPSLQLLMKLGSIVVHVEEALSTKGTGYDIAAMKPLLKDEDVQKMGQRDGRLSSGETMSARDELRERFHGTAGDLGTVVFDQRKAGVSHFGLLWTWGEGSESSPGLLPQTKCAHSPRRHQNRFRQGHRLNKEEGATT